ncbi:hypothetical protein E3Q17_03809 [Wallemia mellicola]|uniref:RRM domain-containing protein n=1 Tax=Wallemia mellicola TaxID=1708541 RepID=A0A4T0NHY4_9BASI|nr:hypothetical protein E3Q17_03809 [Wallemia mellicola]
MQDQYQEVWNHWRESWSVGEAFHLDRIANIPDQSYDDKEKAFLSAIEDVPSSKKISLHYINYLLQGQAQNIMEDTFSEEHIRQTFVTAYEGLEWDLTGSCEIWNLWRDWEMKYLEASTSPESIQRLQQFYIARLKIPHSNHSDTFSAYSGFITTYDNAQYESHMVAANKDYKKGQSIYDDYDQYETSLNLNPSVEAYQAYLYYAQAPNGKRKLANSKVIMTLFEKATRDCYPFSSTTYEDGSGPSGSIDETTATNIATIWESYVNWMLNNKERPDKTLNVIERSVKVCPWSGELWAALIRANEQFGHQPNKAEETYARAISSGLLESRVNDLVALIISRASYLRHTLQDADLEIVYPEVAAVLEDGLERVKGRDTYNRVEKYAISWHERIDDETAKNAATQIFQRMTKNNAQRTNYAVWLDWAAFEIRSKNYDNARNIFKSATPRQFIDYPEAIHQAYREFEDHYGSLETRQQAHFIINKAIGSLAERRAKEAAQAYEMYTQQQQPAVAVNEATNPIDTSENTTGGVKRKADEDLDDESTKRHKVQQAVETLKRDRENTTVMVSGLPSGISDVDIKLLFKDCGTVREIILKQLKGQSAATVEFNSRDDVLAALTKDKKRIEDIEINVVMGWSATLYVTNFPEGTKDEELRALFEPYGTIFDTRWPSRSVKTNRRFAYVTFLDPTSAQASLELNGRIQQDKHPLTVAISDPSKRKSRSDDFVNGCEVFVRELGKRMSENELVQLFEPFGAIKNAKMGLRDDGSCKGFAHVEFENATSAQAALALNNAEIKGKHISVTMSNRKPRQANAPARPRFGRSIRVHNIPEGVKEFVLQQTFEKIAPIKKVWYNENGIERAAVVEFEDEKEMSKILLMQAPSINGQILSLSDESEHQKPLNLSSKSDQSKQPSGSSAQFGHMVPRNSKKPKIGSRGINPVSQSTASDNNAKSQDDFRKFLK